jgi:amidase/aspartyl-tRNA(Asn)/glutamyl-tRNA(Gln) amidotransferase subunit A
MSRFSSVSEQEVTELAASLDLSCTPEEALAAVDRIDALSDIYASLENSPGGGVASDGADGEVFETTPWRPEADENPYNEWITRFRLERPDAAGPLDDLDVAVKDNMCVRGVEMTCGSRALEGFVPGDHAAVVHALLDAGATVVGKTNMDEFAFGPTSETSAFGPTANPVDTDHVAGGSSSGSAAAVAAGEVDLALGSDTGGSVRIPASYCGIVGIKPTYGLASLVGVAEMSYSMDHVGPLARDVETAARGLDVITDAHPSVDGPFGDDPGTDLSELVVGVEERFFETYVTDEVERAVRDAIAALAAAGAEIRSVDVPTLEYSREAWWGIAPAEFAAAYATNMSGLWRTGPVDPSFVAGVAGIRGSASRDLGANVKEMLVLGGHVNRTHDGYHYVRGRNLRAALKREFDAALGAVDVLVTPTTPTTALEIGGFDRGTTPPVNWDTHPTNLTGHPSISVPCADVDDLPVGLQFVGSWYDDATVVDVAAAYESAT